MVSQIQLAFSKDRAIGSVEGVPVPPQEEPPAPEDCVIDLPPPDSILKSYGENQRQKSESRSDMDMKSREKVIPELSERAAVLYHLLNNRKSRRKYTEEPLAIEELSYLLWAIEGVKENRDKFSFRTTPSGGARARSMSISLLTRSRASM